MFISWISALAWIALVEVLALVLLAHLVGWGWTFGISVLSALVGAVLVAYSGRAWWRDLQRELRGGGLPAYRMGEGVLLLVAAAMVLTPGPLTGLFGFFLLIPRVRRWVLWMLWRYVQVRWWRR